jgi:PAS domain S-box-containing protein
MEARSQSDIPVNMDSETANSALLQAMVNNAVDGIIAIDDGGIIQLINRAGEHLFGYQSDEVLGRNIAMLMPEPYRSQHGRFIQNYLETGQRKIIGIGREVMGRHKDGTTFPMHLSVTEVKMGDKRLFTGIVHDLTDRKKGEEALKRERDRAQQYLDIAGVIILLIGTDKKVSLINRKGCAVLGYPEHEIVGKNWFNHFIPRRHRAQVKGVFNKIVSGETGLVEHYENPVLTRTGEERLITWHNSIVHDEHGTITGTLSSGEDITEQKQAEEQLRQSEEQLRLTLENAPIGIITTDLEGRLLSVNPTFCMILGYSTRELLNMSIRDFTHPEDMQETLIHFELLSRGETVGCELEKRYLRKDGRTIDVRARGGLVRDAQGKPLRIVAEVEDITARKRANYEIRRMRAYLQNIINSMPSVLVGVDIDGHITEWNTGAEKATGIPASKAMGKCFIDMMPQLESQLRLVHDAIEQGESQRTERLITKHNGESRYAEVMVYPLVANGSIGAVIRVDDITNRIRIEQIMVQTEKMMSVGGLAAGMAHEINNPLSAVLQSSQNIVRRLSPELEPNRKVAEELGLDLQRVGQYMERRGISSFLEGIQEAGVRAGHIVNDMLSFSRRSETHIVPIRLTDMLETVLRLSASDYDLKKNYEFKQIEIIRDYDKQLDQVYCDRTEIEQVLLNLIKNAAHAMAEAGSPTPHQITLRTRHDKDCVRIEVEDNGPGMEEQVRRRVFEPFFTTKPIGVGTGLGLSVSYFIITEQHKGTITVHSTPGQGSRFTIRLPHTRQQHECTGTGGRR